MKVLKNSFKEIEWNKWGTGDRNKDIEREIEKLSPPWVCYKENLEVPREDENNEKMNREISIEEISRALDKVKTSSSPGLDRIDYKILMEMPIILKKEMVTIFNGLLRENEIP